MNMLPIYLFLLTATGAASGYEGKGVTDSAGTFDLFVNHLQTILAITAFVEYVCEACTSYNKSNALRLGLMTM